MKKKKSDQILLDPIDYWEKKLNINYNTEFLRYKKLCVKTTKKEERKFDGHYYISYDDWNEHIIDTIKNLDHIELQHYIRFLNGRLICKKTDINLVHIILIPCAISLLGLMLSTFFDDMLSLTQSSDKMANDVFPFFTTVAIFFVLVYAFFIIVMKKLIRSTQKASLDFSFYSDMKEIVEKQLESIKNPSL